MQCLSTRGGDSAPITLALQRGLALDGGLYLPERLPQFQLTDFDGAEALPSVATRMLLPFFADTELAEQIGAICCEALNFATPLVALPEPNSHVLELFHGPTAAFKDIGARFLAECLARLRDPMAADVTVLAATSGDTGSAVAAAFHGRPGFRAAILFPDGRVSPRQAHLLSCFGDNIASYAVQGNFDACQAMVKAAFANAELQSRCPLTSANSISLGRLLPQAAYYAQSALAHWRRHGTPLNFVIPSGNLGNGLAAVYARMMGLPLGEIVLATNANRVLPDFLQSGTYTPQASIATLANAMDVGAPSNLERLRALFPDHSALRGQVSARAVDDSQIRARIQAFKAEQGMVICPHTAVAAEVLADLRAAGDQRPWAIVATAHPAKFESVVEPLVGGPVAIPEGMRYWLDRPAQAEPLAAEPAALARRLLQVD